jgi:hypothetical protein
VARKLGRAQHPRTAITANYMGPNHGNGTLVFTKEGVILAYTPLEHGLGIFPAGHLLLRGASFTGTRQETVDTAKD